MLAKGFHRVVVAMLAVAIGLPAAASAQGEAAEERFRLAGEVTAIALDEQVVEVQTLRGEDWRIQVTSETVYRSPGGEIEGLADLETGMRVVVIGFLTEDGAVAHTIGVAAGQDRPRLQRAAGTITAVRPSVPSFELEPRQGESLTFLVTDQTGFVSRDGQIQGVGDLEPGMPAAVVYHQRDGEQVALRVVVGHESEDRPPAGVRAHGKVTAYSRQSITVEDRDGESVTFVITDSTRIKRRGGGEVQVGDYAFVAGQVDDEGRPMAVLILATPADADRPDRPPVRPQLQPRATQEAPAER